MRFFVAIVRLTQGFLLFHHLCFVMNSLKVLTIKSLIQRNISICYQNLPIWAEYLSLISIYICLPTFPLSSGKVRHGNAWWFLAHKTGTRSRSYDFYYMIRMVQSFIWPIFCLNWILRFDTESEVLKAFHFAPC